MSTRTQEALPGQPGGASFFCVRARGGPAVSTSKRRRTRTSTDDASARGRRPSEGEAVSEVEPFPEIAHPKKRAFLAAYARTGNVTQAAAAAGITRRTHYVWLHEDGPDGDAYREAFERAEEEAADWLEAEARRRAVEGVVRYKFDKKGNPLRHPVTGEPYYELEYSDTLLIFLLKGARPDKYADRQKHEVTGKNGAPFVVVMQEDLPKDVYGDGSE